MSRLGLKLSFVIVLMTVAVIAHMTSRNIRLIENEQNERMRSAGEDHLAAVRQIFSEEEGRIAARLQPLARVRELRFRVQPAVRESTEPGAPAPRDTAAVADSGVSAESRPAPAPLDPAPDGPVISGPLDPVGLQRFIEEILPVTGLDALEVADAQGVILARGHYPEAFGETRADLDMARLQRGEIVSGVRQDLFRAGQSPVLFASLPIQSLPGDSASFVGVLSGSLRLDRLAERLGKLKGSLVLIRTGDAVVSSAGSAVEIAGEGLVEHGREYFWISRADLPPAGALTILEPATAGVLTQRKLVDATLRYGAIATVVAAIVGILLALGPTRRLAKLTKAAVRIGSGDLETPVAVSGGDEIGVLGRTLSDTARALAEMREKQARSERVAAWRDAARRLAHELKNAITPIGLSLRTVRRAEEKGPEGRAAADEALTAIGEELKHLQSLVDQFSQFARMPAPRMAPYDLVTALRNAATLYGAAGPKIELKAPDKMEHIPADEELMGRVWSNLITNAAQAAGKEGWVEIEIAPGGKSVTVSITDSGPGLSKDRLEGKAAEGESTKSGGWGVGLALAERIVAEHGGTFVLENVPHAGARVKVELGYGSPEKR